MRLHRNEAKARADVLASWGSTAPMIRLVGGSSSRTVTSRGTFPSASCGSTLTPIPLATIERMDALSSALTFTIESNSLPRKCAYT